MTELNLNNLDPNKVEDAFLKDLKVLLVKHRATFEVDDHWTGYAECGKDLRLTVEIPPVWDKDGQLVNAGVDINLGTYITADNILKD